MSTNLRPPTARDLELLHMDTVASQMPVIFANGAEWREIQCECKQCNKPLPTNQVRGIIVRQTEHMFSLESVGICHECRVITRYTFRLHDNMTLSGQTDDGWRTWSGKPQSLFDRLQAFLGWGQG